jgi:hypothetical protein
VKIGNRKTRKDKVGVKPWQPVRNKPGAAKG